MIPVTSKIIWRSCNCRYIQATIRVVQTIQNLCTTCNDHDRYVIVSLSGYTPQTSTGSYNRENSQEFTLDNKFGVYPRKNETQCARFVSVICTTKQVSEIVRSRLICTLREITIRVFYTSEIEIILSATNWIVDCHHRSLTRFCSWQTCDGQCLVIRVACRQPEIWLSNVSDLWLKSSTPSQTIKTSSNFSHTIRVRNSVIEYREQYKRPNCSTELWQGSTYQEEFLLILRNYPLLREKYLCLILKKE